MKSGQGMQMSVVNLKGQGSNNIIISSKPKKE
jgi:hypothetical protein